MNDILRPELIWIEGRCYRVNDPTTEVSTLQEQDLYENDMPYNIDEDDGDDECEITQVDQNRYCTTLHVSKHYMGFVIGKKGATIGRIGRDTRTDIKIPRQGENKDITIYGSNISSIKAARRRINLIVMASRMKQSYTHFISIPINDANIIKNFEKFKETVLRECQNSGIEDSIFISGYKLHLTVGVMCLMDNEERMLASKLLTEAKDKFIMTLKIYNCGKQTLETRANPTLINIFCSRPLLHNYLPLKIRVKGISYMNDDPKQIDVLYGCVEEVNAPKGLLQRTVDAILEHFSKEGLMKKDFGRDNVKMHVTLMNSKYRGKQNVTDESPKHVAKREAFDGSQVLEKFLDYDFGTMELSSIHLSQRGTVGPDGYYQSTCIISCNKQ